MGKKYRVLQKDEPNLKLRSKNTFKPYRYVLTTKHENTCLQKFEILHTFFCPLVKQLKVTYPKLGNVVLMYSITSCLVVQLKTKGPGFCSI